MASQLKSVHQHKNGRTAIERAGRQVRGCVKPPSSQETDLKYRTLHGSLHVWVDTAALSGPWGLIQRVPMSSQDLGLGKCETKASSLFFLFYAAAHLQ